MRNTGSTPRPETDRYAGPGAYKIEFEGELSADWARRVGDLRVTSWRSPQGGHRTVLSGRVCDQAALAGVLNTIYELHLPLISVQRLDEDLQPGDVAG